MIAGTVEITNGRYQVNMHKGYKSNHTPQKNSGMKQSLGKKNEAFVIDDFSKGGRGITALGSGTRPRLQSALVAAPRPVDLPSLRRENAGLDPSVNIVPAGGSGWATARKDTTSGVGRKSTTPGDDSRVGAAPSKPSPRTWGTGGVSGPTASSPDFPTAAEAMRSQKAEKAEKAERIEKTHGAEKLEKADKAERLEKAERAEKLQIAERSEATVNFFLAFPSPFFRKKYSSNWIPAVITRPLVAWLDPSQRVSKLTG